MLTLQLINQDPEEVIRRLAVKQFDGREPIMRIVELDKHVVHCKNNATITPLCLIKWPPRSVPS